MSDLQIDPTIIGLTSTIPVEIIFAAGLKPVDLNNIFINADQPDKLIYQAELDGFSNNICAWIKGMYSIVINKGIKTVIAVTGGDCSNTIALAELLERRGVRVISFDYPFNRDKDLLMNQIENLRQSLSAGWDAINSVKSKLDRIRAKLRELDRLTFQGNVVTGFENHLFLVNSSDFKSDPDSYEKELNELLVMARKRKPKDVEIRLGYIGVPPIFGGFYEYIETLAARVVYNEVQRQFSMPYKKESILDQYLSYSYPYEIKGRIDDIERAIQERELDGIIHYTQTFCFRQIYDIIFRESLSRPVLTLEGDRPGLMDSRTVTRIEIFVDMLKGRKSG